MGVLRSVARTIVPRPIRVVLNEAIIGFTTFRVRKQLSGRAKQSFRGKAVAIGSVFSTRSGIGRCADLLARDFESRGIKVVRVDLPWVGLAPIANHGAVTPQACQAHDDITDVIIVLNPPNVLRLLARFDMAWLRKRTIISYWVYEFEQLPATWAKTAAVCDEIWCMSEFIEAGAKSLSSTPARTRPPPVDIDPFPKRDPELRAATRQKLGIEPATFCVGYSFAVSSNLPRKNPQALVDAFHLAFPDDGARLILRGLDGHVYPEGWSNFRDGLFGDSRITLIEQSSDLSLRAFYAAIDVYASPSRAEGYGLNLAEATQAGVPVLTMGWSLGQDVATRPGVEIVKHRLVPVDDPQGNYRNAAGLRWAEPILEDFAAKLRTAREAFLAGPLKVPA